jgi:MscS family membrane protein
MRSQPMMSPRNARGRRRHLSLFAVSLGFAVSVVAAPLVVAEEATPPAATPQPAGPADELERGVPRTAMLGYLQACRSGDYKRAAEYLDLNRISAKDRAGKGPVLAWRLKVVVDHALWIDPDDLSDVPTGHTDDGLSSRRDRVGTIHTTKGAVDVLLERVPREDGVPIWKISAATVAQIPALYGEFGYGPLGELLPAPLFEISFLQIELWQWIGLAVLIVVSVLTSWVLAAMIERLAKSLVVHLRHTMENKLEQLIVGPVRLAIGITIFYAGSFLLALSLPVRAFFNGVAETLVIAALTWLGLRLIDMGALRMEDRFLTRGHAAAVAVLHLGSRTTKVFLVVIASLALLQNLGFNVSGVLAGLGVGGLAVALAAQETVKNFFGGVALIADQPVRVGDFCRFGDKMGIVEDISIWSTRVRTLDRTVVSVPNGQFASLQLENFSRRDRMWLHTTLGLHHDTTPDQLRRILEQIREMLSAHPKVHRENARARFVGLGGPSFQIEISAYVLTSSLSEFLAVREDLFLQMMDIVSRNTAKFAT